MKGILFFFFIAFSANAQTALHNIVKSCNYYSETDISKSNRIKYYIGKDELTKFNATKVIELYKDLSIVPEFYIVPINISAEFNVYVEIPFDVIGEKKNIMTPAIYGSYLLFDKKVNILYRIESDMACGSVYKKSKKILVTNSSFNTLMDPVFIVDKNFNNLKI
ncbi:MULTISPECIES: hypothetical protein [unclassified Flavobacterium]|uniref:hypothetical protein n=1 Tax=unclassified Flavobacterium TaxID=196869 RepID=UPI000F0CA310|nr:MULTISPECIES: hypothetical protein [unclassified Flavobacterium]AYN04426.1 hypothetical protein EAG11_09725 [Flavobacterium sp. 140616W15]MCD0476259.1 hypothetical protein [Flavobacterium sp. EDS]